MLEMIKIKKVSDDKPDTFFRFDLAILTRLDFIPQMRQ